MPENLSSSTHAHRSLTAIITGAAGGIGAVEAERLVTAGRHVVLNDIDAGRLAQTVQRLGGSEVATAVPGDISETATARALVAEATRGGRRLETVINNAGITADRMVFNLTDEDWDRAIAINLRGTFLLSREAARYWRREAKVSVTIERANLVNTTSRAALLANPGQTNYAAAKAGVAVMTQIMARELRRYGVRCNAIAPRAFTRMMRDSFGDFEESELEEWSPSHVANFVDFLCGAGGVDITGQVFVVQGRHVALARPWTISDAVDLDYARNAEDVLRDLGPVFSGEPTEIAPFQIGGDLPVAHSVQL